MVLVKTHGTTVVLDKNGPKVYTLCKTSCAQGRVKTPGTFILFTNCAKKGEGYIDDA